MKFLFFIKAGWEWEWSSNQQRLCFQLDKVLEALPLSTQSSAIKVTLINILAYCAIYRVNAHVLMYLLILVDHRKVTFMCESDRSG